MHDLSVAFRCTDLKSQADAKDHFKSEFYHYPIVMTVAIRPGVERCVSYPQIIIAHSQPNQFAEASTKTRFN